jgi:hypothetical protein
MIALRSSRLCLRYLCPQFLHLRFLSAVFAICAAMAPSFAQEQSNVVIVSLTTSNPTTILGIGTTVGKIIIRDQNGNPASFDEAMAFSLSAKVDDEMVATGSVTIPAGASSAPYIVTPLALGLHDDPATVTATFAYGTVTGSVNSVLNILASLFG